MIKLITILMTLISNVYALNLSGEIINDYMYSSKKKYAPGVFVRLLSWKDQAVERCLIYKTPLKNKSGELYLIPSSTCDLKKFKTDHVYIKDINSFSFEKEDGFYTLSYNEKKERLVFPMSDGLTYLSNKKEPVKKLKDGDVCRKQNTRCEEFEVDDCKSCENGIWEAFLNWKCGRTSQRVCGTSSCGHKNQQACLRALASINGTSDLLNCDEAKALTYCLKGLQVICEGDGRVICR